MSSLQPFAPLVSAERAFLAPIAWVGLVIAWGCGSTPTPVAPPGSVASSAEHSPATTIDAATAPASDEERLAAIQKAMNELDEAAQQCWAAAATERFDIEGELALQIEIGAATSQVVVVRDTAKNAKLAACVGQLLAGYRWAPPLYGQTIQLPFKFRAPDGQSTIDRALVPWNGQGKVSVAVLLDENNTGNEAASMFEIAVAAGGTTGLRRAERAELWYFLGAGEVRGAPARGTRSTGRAVAAGDMMYAPRGSAREVVATGGDLHAMIVMVPGGREGTARGGALPTPEATTGAAPMILPASAAKTHGPATIFLEAAVSRDAPMAASILSLPAGGKVPEHVHAGETEVLYILAGGGTMMVAGVPLPVVPTSVVQIPKNTKHAFTATSDVRAVQIYTPAGPEQRFKARP